NAQQIPQQNTSQCRGWPF
ncbi:hypothetical protein WJX79_004399, partial [Trebouxia sp. C0005]